MIGGNNTKTHHNLISLFCIALLLGAFFSAPVFALTESEVEAQIEASGKEAVVGNVLIWFLCAVGFLKVSQKIDSFMQSIGMNVGQTGGSLLSEALIATRGISMIAGVAGGIGRRASGAQGVGGYFKGGLAGMASRKAASNAAKTAASNTTIPSPHSPLGQAVRGTANSPKAPVTAQASSLAQGARLTDQSRTAPTLHKDVNDTGDMATHLIVPGEPQPVGGAPLINMEPDEQNAVSVTDANAAIIAPPKEGESVGNGVIVTSTRGTPLSDGRTVQTNRETAEPKGTTSASAGSGGRAMAPAGSSFRAYGLGGRLFMKSLASGGSFANEVIGGVARGDIESAGTISGEMATQALNSYLGFTAMGADAGATPNYYHVEMGGGRISGVECEPETHQDVQFCMYDASQYAEPQGEYTKVVTADGATWYKQYEQDAVDRKPYHAPDGTIAYEETIVKRMPKPPMRKSRM